jgi:hypothetical protein
LTSSSSRRRAACKEGGREGGRKAGAHESRNNWCWSREGFAFAGRVKTRGPPHEQQKQRAEDEGKVQRHGCARRVQRLVQQ